MIRKNLFANYMGTAFLAVSQIVVIPLYLHYLGERDWGLLSSLLALAATLLILETGVSQAVARGISEGKDASQSIDRRGFSVIERRYLVTTLGASGVLAILSGPLGAVLLPHEGANARFFALTAIAMAASQIIGSLYRGTLIGKGAQIKLNLLIVAMTILRHGIGVTFALKGYGVASVAAALAGSYFVEAVLRRCLVATLLSARANDEGESQDDGQRLVARGATTLAAAGTIGALATQLDRLLLGTTVSPVELGRYAIAATLSLAVLQLIYPISNALMPHLKDLQTTGASAKLLKRSYAMLLAILIPTWCGAAFIASNGLQLWLPRVDSANIAAAVAPLFLIHLAGTTLNALCVPLHMSLLAAHLDRGILLANICSICALTITLVAFVAPLREAAGSFGWLCGNAILLISYCGIYRNRLLKS